MRVRSGLLAACVALSPIVSGCNTDASRIPTRESGAPAVDAPVARGTERPTISSTSADGPTSQAASRFRGHLTGARYVVRAARVTDSGVELRLDVDGVPHRGRIDVGADRAWARLERAAGGRWASLQLDRAAGDDADARIVVREAAGTESVIVESAVRPDGTLVETYRHSGGDVRSWVFPSGRVAGDDWQEEYLHWLGAGSELTDANPLIRHLRELLSDPAMTSLLESLGAVDPGDRLAGFLCLLGVRCTVHGCIAAPGSPICAACAGAATVFCLASWLSR